jgi:hypothetical protein
MNGLVRSPVELAFVMQPTPELPTAADRLEQLLLARHAGVPLPMPPEPFHLDHDVWLRVREAQLELPADMDVEDVVAAIRGRPNRQDPAGMLPPMLRALDRLIHEARGN